MKPVKFPEANAEMQAPPGEEKYVMPLPCFRDGTHIVSCWELSEEEIRELLITKRVWVTMMGIQPPMQFTVKPPFERVEKPLIEKP